MLIQNIVTPLCDANYYSALTFAALGAATIYVVNRKQIIGQSAFSFIEAGTKRRQKSLVRGLPAVLAKRRTGGG